MKFDKQSTKVIEQRQYGPDYLVVYAVLCVQARGRGHCPLNVNLIQHITGLPLPAIVGTINVLAQDGTIRLEVAMPDQEAVI